LSNTIDADLYDFDKTVFPWDSGMRFWLFCLKMKPSLLRYLPAQAAGALRFVLGIGDSARAKSGSLTFIRGIDAHKEATLFWEANGRHIYPFFLPANRQRPAVVCSASPDFLLKPVCDKLGVAKLVCTRVNTGSGQITGKNCKGAEKVCRLADEAPQYHFIHVYTDSVKNDAPMLALGEKAFLVKNGRITPLR